MRKFFVLLLILAPLSAFAANITADSYILVEKDTFAVVAGRDYHRSLPPASTTKVMTTMLALENLDEQASIVPTKKVVSIPASKLSLFPGRPYKAIDLVKGAMVESANDAAYSLAVAVGGSEERFAEMMNDKARQLGAYDTHFENASGLHSPGHFSSTYDLALIFRYALLNPRFQEIVGLKYFPFKRGDADFTYKNHNRLLFCFAPSVGGKTGFTRASRHCYVGAFQKEGRVYILALLGSRNLWGDAVAILQNIYTEVPSQREISLARATHVSHVTLSSYKVVKKEKKTELKKKGPKKTKKAKRRARTRKVHV